MSLRPLLIPVLLLGLALSAAAAPLEVSDTDGRSLSVDLLALAGDKVAFTVAGGDGKEFELPITRFDGSSQAKIREAAGSLKPRVPQVDIEVVVGKRRKKEGYYMVNQTITSKVIVKNTHLTIAFPEASGRIIFIGRSRSNADTYKILSADKFDLTIAPARAFEFEPKIFATRYDSDNFGAGNIGGFQYEAYILAITGADGAVLASKTSSATFRTALDKDLLLISKVLDYPVNTEINKDLVTFKKIVP